MNFAKFKSAGCIIGPIWVSSIRFHLIFGILFVKKILDNDPSLVATLQLTLSDEVWTAAFPTFHICIMFTVTF